MKKPFDYHIIFTNTGKQKALLLALSGFWDRERGRVFIPMREYWIRKDRQLGVKPIFPGYIFFKTDMGRRELHEFIRQNRRDINAFVRELQNRELKDSGLGVEEVFPEDIQDDLPELSSVESELFDNVLDEEGVWRMSGGCRRHGQLIVMDGPLKIYADRIKEVDRHNREAVLDMDFRGHRIVAGLELKPVRTYFPEDKDAPDMLEDGTEVDLKDLANKMMAHAVGFSSQ